MHYELRKGSHISVWYLYEHTKSNQIHNLLTSASTQEKLFIKILELSRLKHFIRLQTASVFCHVDMTFTTFTTFTCFLSFILQKEEYNYRLFRKIILSYDTIVSLRISTCSFVLSLLIVVGWSWTHTRLNTMYGYFFTTTLLNALETSLWWYMCSLSTNYYAERGIISSWFSRYSEAFASDFLKIYCIYRDIFCRSKSSTTP